MIEVADALRRTSLLIESTEKHMNGIKTYVDEAKNKCLEKQYLRASKIQRVDHLLQIIRYS